MVELVVVIVMVGIVAAIALPRLGGSGFDERALHDQIISALRYAQKSAVAARRTVCVTFRTTQTPQRIDFDISTYGASNCSVVSAPLMGPKDTALSIVATGSTSFSASAAAVVFDASGRALAPATVTVSGLPASLAITVESETGYVH